jgi:transcriptional regulator with XRE-family HTH domain
MTVNRTRGDALRLARIALQKTQKEIAGAARVSDRTVIRLEQGHDGSTDSLLSVCAALGLDPRSLPDGMEVAAPNDDMLPSAGVGRRISLGDAIRSMVGLPVTLHVALAALIVMAIPIPYYVGLSQQARHVQPLAIESIEMSGVLAFSRSVVQASQDVLEGSTTTKGIRKAFELLPFAFRCDLQTLAMRIALTNCPVDQVDLHIVGATSQGFRIAVGPMSRSMFKGIVAGMPIDPDVSITVSILPDPKTDVSAGTWIDPLGRRSDALAGFEDGDWIGLNVVRKEDRS